MEKRKRDSPKKQCQFGVKCFRVNPNHFIDFSHPHLESIAEQGVDTTTGEFSTPDECAAGPDRVREQLKIVVDILKNGTEQNPVKLQKVDENEAGSASAMVVSQTKPEPSVTSSSVADFFKERRAAFEAKNPRPIRAQSPARSDNISMPSLTALDYFPPQRNCLPRIPPNLQRFFPLVLPQGRMADKLHCAKPYNMFLTAVTAASATHHDPLTLTFLELLDPSLGELESSVHFNFTVDISWLFAQYTAAGYNKLPLLILYGQECKELSNIHTLVPNITSFMIKVPGPIGCHHAKVMLMFYKDKSMRVVVSTANLYKDDWDNRVQGLWISDKLSRLEDDETDGESVTYFRRDLVEYIENYNNATLRPYIERIKKSDFRSVNVFLITSIPGTFRGESYEKYGHPKLGSLLLQHSAPIDEKHAIIMQSSSLGNYGASAAAYLSDEVTRSFKKDSGVASQARLKAIPDFKLIYPSRKNVEESHDGFMGGGCLPYRRGAQKGQQWLNKFLYQWKSDSRNSTRAMPHIKSYCRYSDEGVFWFALTSHNMSKSAWGVSRRAKGELALNINSYEAGVVFFPKVILGPDDDVFPLNEAQQKNKTPIFKMPFDLPPQPYEQDDVPFVIEDKIEYAENLAAMQSMM